MTSPAPSDEYGYKPDEVDAIIREGITSDPTHFHVLDGGVPAVVFMRPTFEVTR